MCAVPHSEKAFADVSSQVAVNAVDRCLRELTWRAQDCSNGCWFSKPRVHQSIRQGIHGRIDSISTRGRSHFCNHNCIQYIQVMTTEAANGQSLRVVLTILAFDPNLRRIGVF